MAEGSSSKAAPMELDIGKSYTVKPRTTQLREDQLVIQVESLVVFVALRRQGVDISSYILLQDFGGYFEILNGPTYENLVKDFWVRAEVYDERAAAREEREKIAGDKSQEGKTREKMRLVEFKETDIRSAVMGISISIT